MACVKITVPLIRDITMMVLGAGGIAREFFLVPEPNRFRVYAGIALLMGPTFILGIWQAWVAARRPASGQDGGGEASPGRTRTAESSSAPP